MAILSSIFCISLGATLGACLRWLLNLGLNPISSLLPLGTLAANWLGSLLMGLAMGLFCLYPSLNPQWKLLLITGFLGSLTTFSAFAGEMATLINQERYLACLLGLCLHVFGSILLVFLGLFLFRLLIKALA